MLCFPYNANMDIAYSDHWLTLCCIGTPLSVYEHGSIKSLKGFISIKAFWAQGQHSLSSNEQNNNEQKL